MTDSLHCHNDFGDGPLHSIAGLVAGGSAVSTTVNGIGERAGNTSLEELIMTLLLIYGVDLGFNITSYTSSQGLWRSTPHEGP